MALVTEGRLTRTVLGLLVLFTGSTLASLRIPPSIRKWRFIVMRT